MRPPFLIFKVTPRRAGRRKFLIGKRSVLRRKSVN
jgi:hypothetical protein